MLHVLLLFLVLAALAWWAYADARAYRAFCLLEDSARRRAFYRQWTLTSFVLFGLGGLLLLAMTGSLANIWQIPSQFTPLRLVLTAPEAVGTGSTDYVVGALIGVALMLALSVLLWTLQIRKMTMPMIGNIEPLLPRNGAEIVAALPMAVNAGVTEELFFRLALPLLAAQVTGSAFAGFAIATGAFALAHWYQGWKGMLVVLGIGVWFAWLYLSSGSLLKPILIHVLIDLIALALRPAIALRWHARVATN
ncbi:CPBP family intramembrane metalloprotease [Sphingobium sp. AS12]|uniref:CPBP family intramembrane glutamic endopeptidase n=1 Tax=Sphingobium sp. AS12 TaxID=2849495 RepID=UPI001C31CACB|nr:CPBP family intramembrane glutamic endopeptidase [Sphingobium sp. AS12]MBV2149819.1 CPBP family intramembrane metalloprotease [Sphingobium sp. AS12]